MLGKRFCHWPIDTVYHARRLASSNKCLPVQTTVFRSSAFSGYFSAELTRVLGIQLIQYVYFTYWWKKCLFLELRKPILGSLFKYLQVLALISSFSPVTDRAFPHRFIYIYIYVMPLPFYQRRGSFTAFQLWIKANILSFLNKFRYISGCLLKDSTTTTLFLLSQSYSGGGGGKQESFKCYNIRTV